MSEISRTAELVRDNPVEPTITTGALFKINSAKLYVPVITLSENDNIKFLENIKHGFKRAVSWHKYIPEVTTQPKNNSLDDMIDTAFGNINKLFVLSFKNGEDNPARNIFYEYYTPLVEIKGFNAFIDNKPFFFDP